MAPRKKGECQVGEKPITWLRDGEVGSQPIVMLAHGAGAPYTHSFLEHTATGLADRGCTVVRFHFPYMEQQVREEKRRPPNAKGILLDTWRTMIELVESWEPQGAVVLAGKSMGGRMASMLLAEGGAPQAAAAVYLGYPLHPPGKPEKLRSEHLGDVPVPQLFVSGTKDNLCRMDLLEPVLEKLGKRAELYLVEGGDHSLATQRKNPLAGSGAWLDAVQKFVARVS